MARLFKHLSYDNQALIREYASDRVGIHPTASLIKTLEFDVNLQDAPRRYACTHVYAAETDHFIPKNPRSTDYRRLTFYHNQFDERNFPQHFDIDLVWDNLLQNDEIESMGNEDTRTYPNGMPVVDTPHGWGWLRESFAIQ